MERVPCVGLNPYKQVELFKNYRPVIPFELQSDELYAEPSDNVKRKVKTEKIDRSAFRQKMKAMKYAEDKDRIESLAFGNDEGKA